MKKTPWFSCKTKPVRKGEYEVCLGRNYGHVWRAKFNGHKWYQASSGALMDHTVACPDLYQWRGLAEDPNA